MYLFLKYEYTKKCELKTHLNFYKYGSKPLINLSIYMCNYLTILAIVEPLFSRLHLPVPEGGPARADTQVSLPGHRGV